MREVVYKGKEYLTRLPFRKDLFWDLKNKIPMYPLLIISTETGEMMEVEVQYLTLKEDTLLN